MSGVEDFLQSPIEARLEACIKDQLLTVAEHFEIEVSSQWCKDRKGFG